MLFVSQKFAKVKTFGNTVGWKCSLNIYLFKVNNGNIKTKCEISLKLTRKTSERRQLLVQSNNRITRKTLEICSKLTIKTPRRRR